MECFAKEVLVYFETIIRQVMDNHEFEFVYCFATQKGLQEEH